MTMTMTMTMTKNMTAAMTTIFKTSSKRQFLLLAQNDKKGY